MRMPVRKDTQPKGQKVSKGGTVHIKGRATTGEFVQVYRKSLQEGDSFKVALDVLTYPKIRRLRQQKNDDRRMALVGVLQEGIEASALANLKKLGYREKDLEVIAPESTRRQRVNKNQKLTTDESDRAYRLALLCAKATPVFGDEEKAMNWLHSKLDYLDGKSPLELAKTEAGVAIIHNLIERIAWGAAF